jgi:hypothetical protein
MFDAKVIEIFIASPSDVMAERDLIEKVIYEWNTVNSKARELVLQPIRWEKNVTQASKALRRVS